MLLWLLIGLGGPIYAYGNMVSHVYLGGSLIIYLCVGLLGWQVYGKPVED
jgi:hypothetical protein